MSTLYNTYQENKYDMLLFGARGEILKAKMKLEIFTEIG